MKALPSSRRARVLPDALLARVSRPTDGGPCGLDRTLAAALLAVPLLAAVATAQSVTNTRTGTPYGTLAAAIADADPDDTLELSGTLVETVVIDRNLTLRGLPGATLTEASGDLIEVAASVELTIDGLLLDGTGNTRGILAAGSDNRLVVQNSTFSTGSALAGADGGGIHIVEPRLLHLQNVVFAGAGEVWGARGGAVFATATDAAPVVFEDVRFDRIRATGQGGAIWGSNVAITCTGSTFEGTQGSFGGGIYAAFSTLVVERCLFCGTHGSLGGAIFSSADTIIRSTIFLEGTGAANGTAVYGNGGAWSLLNNHVLGMGGPTALYISSLATADAVTNNLLLDNAGTALSVPAGTTGPITYNWFQGNAADANVALDGTNHVNEGDPILSSWQRDGDCTNDELWPTPIASPLIDAGDPAIADPDGSRSDIGAFGGEAGDPFYFADHDGDGSPFFEDSDDTEPTVYPGAPEVCDGLDNDCDGTSDVDPVDPDAFHEDCDGDGQGNPVAALIQCFPPEEPPACGGVWLSEKIDGFFASSDCDDADPNTYWGAPETCVPGDQNCDGDDDRGAIDALTYFFDGDLDGFGDMPTASCSPVPVPGLSDVGGDCADFDPNFYPGAPDFCGDRLDQDCNGHDGTDEEVLAWYPDDDGDGFGDSSAAVVVSCVVGAGVGFVDDNTDCDDGNGTVYPGAAEVCDGIDNDCDGVIDNTGNPSTWYLDGDGDGYGDDLASTSADCQPAGHVATGGDCDDADPLVSPAGSEACDGLDNDCDGVVDNTGVPTTWYLDADGDGYGDDLSSVSADCQPTGYVATGGDCDDADPLVNPGAPGTCDDPDPDDDADGDGIPDEEDSCPGSDLRPTVVIGSCDTGVENVVLESGCSIQDRVAEIAGETRSGVQLVVRLVLFGLELRQAGLIGRQDFVAIVRCAFRSLHS